MTPDDLYTAGILGMKRTQDLRDGIARASTGSRLVGAYDVDTGFCVRVYVANGIPHRWFITGPVSLEDARMELLGPTAHPGSDTSH